MAELGEERPNRLFVSVAPQVVDVEADNLSGSVTSHLSLGGFKSLLLVRVNIGLIFGNLS